MNTKIKNYYKVEPSEIVDDVLKQSDITKVNISNIDFLILPNVYPSHKFRTTQFVLDALPDCRDKKVCDMGCGIGVVGLHSLINKGAKKVTFVDLNEIAIENVHKNLSNHEIPKEKYEVYHSNAFTKVKKEIFDLIVFNIPYHNDFITIEKPIQRAFFDPDFGGVKKFLSQAKDYMTKNSQILIAFSNKGDVETLEQLFNLNNYTWKLWKKTNEDQQFDNRIYLLSI